MAASPDFKLYTANKTYVASSKSLQPLIYMACRYYPGGTIRYGHRAVLLAIPRVDTAIAGPQYYAKLEAEALAVRQTIKETARR